MTKYATTLEVLHGLRTSSIDELLESIQKDSRTLDKEIQKYIDVLKVLLDEEFKHIEDIQERNDAVISILGDLDIKHNSEKNKYHKAALDYAHSTKRMLLGFEGELVSAKVQLTKDIILCCKARFPLNEGKEIGHPSYSEEKSYIGNVLFNILGFIPFVNVGVTFVSISEAIKEWKEHTVKFNDAITRVTAIIEFIELLDNFKKDGLANFKMLAEQRQTEVSRISQFLCDIKKEYNDYQARISNLDLKLENLKPL